MALLKAESQTTTNRLLFLILSHEFILYLFTNRTYRCNGLNKYNTDILLRMKTERSRICQTNRNLKNTYSILK